MPSDMVLRQLPWTTKPKISVKPGPFFSVVSISFQALTKYLSILNSAKYNIAITTYHKWQIMQKMVDVKLDVKVPTMALIRGLSMSLKKGREKTNYSPWLPIYEKLP